MIESLPLARRRRRVVVVLALLLVAIPTGACAVAQTDRAPPGGVVRVTAGEHGDFSRVVFALGAGRGYRTEIEPDGFRIVFPDALVGFEYGEVYPKRRAHRVIMAEPALTDAGASLRLKFGCDCTAHTFVLGEKLVVDVFDATSSASAPDQSALGPAGPRTATPSGVAKSGGGAALNPTPLAADQRTTAGASTGRQPRPEFLRRVENLSDPEPPAPGPQVAPGAADLDPDHLERMLAWVIEHGHLTGASPNGDPVSPPAEKPKAKVAAPYLNRAADTQTAPAPQAGVRDQEPQAAPTNSCPDDSALDMAALGGQEDFAAERARRHDALSRAVAAGRGIAEAEQALAGFYIARLMPQEALAVLGKADEDGAGAPTWVWLKAAALVLADRRGEAATSVVRSSSCQGANARLWRAVLLAAQGPLSKDLLESEAIHRRLTAYPPDLRVELGLRLAEAGFTAPAHEAIVQLLDLVEQASPSDEATARLLFLRGRLAASRGDFAGARASWQGAAGLPGEGGARATMALIELDLERGELDEAGALSELERLTYDWRGHPLQLCVAQLTAAIHERQGRLSDALGALEEVAFDAAGQPNGRAAARLATDLMRRAYADAPATLPTDLLSAFWRYEGFVPPGVEGADVRIAIARTLIANSLPEPAIKLLQPVTRDADSAAAEKAIDLLAEGYLTANQPLQALDLLRAAARTASAAKASRNLLAARALAALGRFAEAAGVLHGNAGDETARLHADYLWKAGLWKEAAAAYQELLRNGPQQDQPAAARQAAIRLAAAAHMAKRPALFEGASRAAEATGDEVAVTAFAPLPAPARSRVAARTAAAQLLEQARGLGTLAEQYGVGRQETP